jgi:hypothetical protein
MYRGERADRMTGRPAWIWLYVLAALVLAPFVLVAKFVPEGAGRTALELGSVVLLIGALALWVRANRVGLEAQGRRVSGWRRVPIDEHPSAHPVDRPHLEGADLRLHPLTGDRLPRPARQKGPRHAGFAFVSRG